MIDNEKFEMRNTYGICGLPALMWPKTDRGLFGQVGFQVVAVDGPIKDLAEDTHIWMNMIENKWVVVQAGGAAGMYPVYYSSRFEKVYTFEPEADNFTCLEYNCKNIKNVHYKNAGLSSVAGNATLAKIAPQNAGMHRIVDPATLSANVPQEILSTIELVTIDSLDLEVCNLIHLDVELHELEALKGAEETIKRCKPIIVVETGGRPSPAHEYLVSLGYKLHTQARMDAVYVVA